MIRNLRAVALCGSSFYARQLLAFRRIKHFYKRKVFRTLLYDRSRCFAVSALAMEGGRRRFGRYCRRCRQGALVMEGEEAVESEATVEWTVLFGEKSS